MLGEPADIGAEIFKPNWLGIGPLRLCRDAPK